MSSTTNSSPPQSTSMIMPMNREDQHIEEVINANVALRVARVNPKYFDAKKDALKHSHRSQFSKKIDDIPDRYDMNSSSYSWDELNQLKDGIRGCEEAEEEFHGVRGVVESYNTLPVAPSPGYLLPLDVLREIFSLIPHAASGLSKEIQHWLDPILFQNIIIRNSDSGPELVASLQGQSSPPSPRLIRASTIVKRISVLRTFTAIPEVLWSREMFEPPINPLSADVWKGITLWADAPAMRVEFSQTFEGFIVNPGTFLPVQTLTFCPHLFTKQSHTSPSIYGSMEI
ncbi:hypothetical protein DL96DRAFT_1683075 [Flagelloscypha sp. PMI_526]|nr:hypothetical protein DL96DRAFT_1683075 [Flagelloscypha sp. PMI_526]